MKSKVMVWGIAAAVLCGCATWREYREDYLKADQQSDATLKESMQTFKYDYLNANRPIMTEERKTAILKIAKETLLKSELKSDYQLDFPEIDESMRMPETYGYIFVSFPPVTTNPKITQTTFLVVIHRFYDRVLFSGVYTQPKGDPFYRYSDIISKIK
ncbi:MAG: hypothetical protein HQL23_09430 [Candidatus Omnitrophica bacterium]|nr:hypothetical protein [Candidatus Omnitrophota bacterium]